MSNLGSGDRSAAELAILGRAELERAVDEISRGFFRGAHSPLLVLLEGSELRGLAREAPRLAELSFLGVPVNGVLGTGRILSGNPLREGIGDAGLHSGLY